MQIVINIESATPIFTQLREQVKQAVANGEIKPGAALPSIRQLANDLEINSKTVAKAYSLLERDCIIQSKGYRGSFIHPEAQANCELDLNRVINKTISQTISTLKAAGATNSEIRIAFNTVLKNTKN